MLTYEMHISTEIIKKKGNALKMVEGEFEVTSQYHFYMETQTMLIRPSEKGQLDVFASTQHMETVQRLISQALNKAENLINIQVRRVGGGYGGKVNNSGRIAAAAAVAAVKLDRPVRLVLDLKSNMEVLGRRHPFMAKYKAGADESGILQFVDLDIYSDSGFSFYDDTVDLAIYFAKVCTVVFPSGNF